MSDEPKGPGLRTQFGALDERTTAVESEAAKIIRRLGEQDKELLQIKTQGRLAIKQVAEQDKELLLVKQATARTEGKVDQLTKATKDLVTAAGRATAFFDGLVWISEKIKQLAPVFIVIAACGGVWAWVTRH